MRRKLGERIIFQGRRYNLVNDKEVNGKRHVIYREDRDDPGPDIILTETGSVLQTLNPAMEMHAIEKGERDVEKHGRKVEDKDGLRELDRHEKEAEDEERETKRKKPKVRKKRGN